MALGHWARWWLLPFFCTGCVALVRSADASAAAELSDGASARLKDAEASNIGRWWVNCIAILVQVWYICCKLMYSKLFSRKAE